MEMSDKKKDEQISVEKYKLLFQLWSSENPVKTGKLQTLMLVNSILLPAFLLTGGSIWIAFVGFLFSAVWILSLGRTMNFQSHWLSQMEELRKQHMENPLFHIHSKEKKFTIWGRVPSKYFLMGSCTASTIAWLCVILYIAINSLERR